MSSNNSHFILPSAIYFDTNILFQIAPGRSNVAFVEMRGSSDVVGIGLFVPQIVTMELISKLSSQVEENLRKAREASKELLRDLGLDLVNISESPEIKKTVAQRVLEHIVSIGVEVIPTPDDISLRELVEMAAWKIAPFEEKKEKGFKDSIILFSILRHLQENKIKAAMLLTNDRIFEHNEVARRFSKAGVSISIARDFLQAKELLDQQISEAAKKYIQSEKRKVMDFLAPRSKKIFAFILSKAEVSITFVEGKNFPAEKQIYGSVEKILAVRPKEISNVFPSFLAKPTELKDIKPISISVTVEFDLFVRQYLPLWLLGGPKFPISSVEEFEKVKYETPEVSYKTETVERQISVEANIKLDNEDYSDLELLRVLAY